jgi:hypothetical protein
MPIPLPKGVLFAYSLSIDTDASLTVTVTGQGAVDYAPPSDGGFERAGTLNPGESIDLDTPGLLRSDVGSEVELAYTHPDPEPPNIPPEVPPDT